jgi:flagellin-specific chaperone FliS
VDYRKEELKFADNEQRVVAVHEHLVSLVTQARKALENKEPQRLKKLLDAAMDTVATLDMHLDFRSNPAFAATIRRWYAFWTLCMMDARQAEGESVAATLQELEDSLKEFVLSLRDGMVLRNAPVPEQKGSQKGGVSFNA